MKIVFFGTPEFAAYSLEQILKSDVCEVGAVVTMPDKLAGRGHKLIHSAVKAMALEHNLPLLQPTNLKDPEFIEALRGVGADLFVVIAFRMLPEAVWAMPPLGTFNLHASLLPAYRGAAPINWAIINGETFTGVTTFFLKHEIDTGDIIAQEQVQITPEDNVGTLHDRLMVLGAELTVQTITRLAQGEHIQTQPQGEIAGKSAAAPKIFTDTCQIHWNRPAQEIHNLVRGLSPYPGAWTDSSAGIIKVFETQPLSQKPSRKGLFVPCRDGVIEILSLQPAGKRRMPAQDFLNGLKEEFSVKI